MAAHSALSLRNEILMPYNPRLAKVNVNCHTKNQNHKSNGLALKVFTHKHKDNSDYVTSTTDAGGNEQTWQSSVFGKD